MFGISEQIAQWSEASGVDEATLKMVICLFSSFPLNAILKRIPDKNILGKNLFIIGISSFYLFGICSIFDGFRTLFISSTFTYLITRYLKSDLMPAINFAFVMGHLAFNHIFLQFFNEYDSGKIDITGAQMVLVMKLSAFGWNVHDGRKPDSELTDYQRQKAVRQHPTLLTFLSYTFFYPSLLTGPAFDFIDYQKWMNSELFTDLPENKKPGKKRKRNIPRSGRVSFYRILQAVGWLLIWQKSGEYVSVPALFEPKFSTHSFFFKVFYLYVLAFTYRLKYYAAWTISEASCILAGLGYNGYDKETGTILWNRVQNVDVFTLETSQNIHGILEAWNQNTNKWLKYYVYLRVSKPGKKPGFRSTLITFLTSAFWHGTRPGYYLSFATGALYQTCGKIFRRNLRPIFLESDGSPKDTKIIYDAVTFVVAQAGLGYLVQPFVILDFKRSLYVWSTTYYWGHIGIFITFFLFQGPFKKQVIGFFKKYHPVKQEAKLTDIISQKSESDEQEAIHLGIPEADFEYADIQRLQDELSEMKEDYRKWKNENGPEKEEQNLKEAVEALTKDLEELKNEHNRKIQAATKKD